MIAYPASRSIRLGQVAYAQPYPPEGLEWGQGWGRFFPSSRKIVLPKSPAAGGGVGYVSGGTVLSRQEVEEVTAVAAGQAGVAAGGAGKAASSAAIGTFPLAAAGMAVLVIVGSMVI